MSQDRRNEILVDVESSWHEWFTAIGG